MASDRPVGFGQKAIGAIVLASGWASGWDIDPSASLAFFAALPMVLSGSLRSFPSEGAVRDAFVGLGDAAGGNAHWVEFLGALAQRAAAGIVTVNELATAAWETDERRIRRVFDVLEVPIVMIDPLAGALCEGRLDVPPPVIKNGPPRYAVIIEAENICDDSNRYATFEEAQYAMSSISTSLFGTKRLLRPPGRQPLMTIIRERILKPRSVSIRELP